jgi:UDP-N-acetyl-D-glucosamine dehydrogenase
VLIEKLELKGAAVSFHDPFINIIPKTREHQALAGRKSVQINSSFDLIIISTAHSSFKNLDFSKENIIIVDTRNVLTKSKRPALYFSA